MAQPSTFAQDTSRLVRQLAAGDNIKPQQIADASGITLATVYRKLKGESEFSLTELAKLAPLFNLPAHELIPRT